MKETAQQPIYIVDGARTPFLKARGRPGPFLAVDLAVQLGKKLMLRQPFSPAELDEVILGSVMPTEDECNIARVMALRLGCGKAVPAYTVQRNCGSGMQAIDSACKDIQTGRAELILAGGAEAMSHAPLKLNHYMVNWLADWSQAKQIKDKIKLLLALRPKYFVPVITLMRGLTDPVVNLIMGKTAENVAYRFGITREEMDQFAVESHLRAAKAQAEGNFQAEIMTLYDNEGNFYDNDTGVRADASLEKVAKLPAFFDKKFGQVTAANSAQITDGAALVIVASERAVEKYRLPVLGKIIDIAWAGLEPEEMGLGPVYAVNKLLQQQKLSMNEIDYWEINEAFAAQVLGCIRAWSDEIYCKNYLGLDKALGTLDQTKLNIDGGSVALGHPVGASGARIALHLLHVLKRKNAKRGIATLCIGGGQGGAMLIENVGN